MSEFGALSLVPPLLAIALAIWTRRPILSLFVGVWIGGVIFTGGLGVGQTFDWIAGSIADMFHAQILIFTLLLGSGVALIWRLGGAIAVRNWAVARLESQRTTGVTTWLLGIALFFDDYANTAIVGSTMRDISDRMRISREKLSYIVDSTAAPVATIAISSWVAFQLSMVREAFADIEETAGVETPSAFAVYLESIPYNAYALLAIAMVGIIVLSRRDYGEMLDAEHRSWQTGNVTREDAVPLQEVEKDLGEPVLERPMLRTFFLPIIVLIAVTTIGAFWTGYQAAELAGVGEVLGLTTGEFAETIAGEADWAAALVWGSFAMVLSAIVLGLVYDLFDLEDGVETVLDGFGLMLTAVTILVLAWSISAVAGDLGTGEYVAAATEGVLSPAIFPVVVLLTAAFIAFTMGSSWATMGIVTPIALPVAYNLTGDFTLAPVVVGAVFSGAIFGDHTSPISDTTVLSSTFTGADLIDHVRTQAYYAVTVLLVVVFAYLLNGYLGVPPIVFLPLGVLILVGLVYGLSNLDAGRKGVDPVASSVDVDWDETMAEGIAGPSSPGAGEDPDPSSPSGSESGD
ncbi:Na+/H+ antiporter NhaC family protein [Halobacteria archaeon AArc-curdl1]|uniref:Na+/H+ antiporter NhaC family protein n=1 Tax=Natronosalvus hydrolyticus TaxID=2979988 RepID=A0AAP3E7U9_9EURY|nr:Na+/H+ antiporter NhaC family protein [Halobacteria archaeon AArc-curdl1]